MQELYDARLKRVADAVQLKEPDRVPIVPCFEAFPVYYTRERTNIKWSVQDLFEDYHRATEVFDAFYEHFEPDLGWDPTLFTPVKHMDVAGINWFRWPGKHFEDNMAMCQYVEDEFMKADEYPEAIFDITKFMMICQVVHYAK
jgi:hypothetical protein